MSSRIFQSIVEQLSEASQTTIGVIDADGTVISAGEMSYLGERWLEAAAMIASDPERIVCHEGKTFLALSGWAPTFGYSVFVIGTDAQAAALARTSRVCLNSTKTHYEEKHDKGTFVKNIITDNILPGDIYIRAKELHFQTDTPRAVFLVRQKSRADVAVVELLQSMFSDHQQDFVIAGKTPRGTVYGVYHFLEKFINFKCFTKNIETFDKVETLVVEDLDICENPAFEYREVYFRSAFDTDFCVKNFIFPPFSIGI